MKHRNTFIKAIEHFGEEAQVRKAIEELSEVLCELAKRQNGKGLRIHLISEIADASNMIDQLKMIFGETEIENIAAQKVMKLEEKIQDEMALKLGHRV